MSTLTRTITNVLALASALGLAITSGCESIVDFERMAVGEQVGTQYLEAPGIEFLTYVNCVGIPACVPPGERWRGRCVRLPQVIAEAGAVSGTHAADIRHGQDLPENTVCARLARPAWRVQLHVRNEPDRGDAVVTLAALDAAGTEIGRTVTTVRRGAGFTPVEVRMPDDRIHAIRLSSWGDATLAIDDLTWYERD